ncbi:zinc finger protein 574 [Elysia marginata]|uniref:Zinc finger protein 574 n=1 Tax=Elysia marginata TaxID=1093978 RepID=A0AAV4HJN4_9GAST|nr:zinc finger protein 574 [Elysia marginata]
MISISLSEASASLVRHQGSSRQLQSARNFSTKSHNQHATNPPQLLSNDMERPSCSLCGHTFFDRVQLQAHMEMQHRDTLLKCSLCGKGYKSYQGLQYHMERHKGTSFPCPVCDSRLSSKSKVKRHLLQVHNCIPCASCSQIFPSGPQFTQHVLNCP